MAGLVSEQDSQGQVPSPQRVTDEALTRSLAIIGLDFSDEHRKLMLASVEYARGSYDSLRRTKVPLDTDLPFSFCPALPGFEIPSGASRFRPSKLARAERPSSLEELAFEPVTLLSALVRSRKVTSVELTTMYLNRLKRYSPKLNCLVTLTEATAMKQAERADREIGGGKYRGPLHGIPYGAKDLFATKGTTTSWGSKQFEHQVFDCDATVISKLDAAGAVLLGKLSMGALAKGALWFRGLTKNPWNTDLDSGGSSAGPAAATSAGLVGFSIGTETQGSLVTPAKVCGVTGFRPTYGRVSRHGAMALTWSMDKVGPICRSAEDCALVLKAIHGPDGKDRSVVEAPFHWHAEAPVRAMKIGYLKAEFDKAEGDRKRIYDAAIEDLRRAGLRWNASNCQNLMQARSGSCWLRRPRPLSTTSLATAR